MTPGRRGVKVDGVKGVDRAVLIRTSMGALRRSVKKHQVLSRSLATHPSVLSAARARYGPDRPEQFKINRPRYARTGTRKGKALYGGEIRAWADALGVSLPTAERWWAFARSWLFTELSGPG